MRKIRGVLLLALAALFLSGCQETPEAPIVIQKKAATEAETVTAEEGMKIADQVQVPEKYTAAVKDPNGIIKVNVDADIVIPEAEGFRLKKVEGRVFNQEDLDKQVDVLLKGGTLTAKVYREDDPAGGWTKSELEEVIVQLKAKREAGVDFDEYYGEGNYNVDEEIAKFDKLYELAPETAETEVVEPVISYDENSQDLNDNQIDGEVDIDGNHYWYYMTNSWSHDWKWVQNSLRRAGLSSNYSEIYGPESKDNDLPMKLTPEEATEKADKLIADLGFDYMKAAGGEYFTTIAPEEAELSTAKATKGYGIHYTRVVDGIPITYTDNPGASVEETENDKYTTSWPYEVLKVVYDDVGLAEFNWENPYTISDLSDEYVFLLPFSEISSIFEQMILTKNADMTSEYFKSVEFNITEVRLGYSRIMEKGSPGSGTLVPVWDFFGSQRMVYQPQALEDGTTTELEDSKMNLPYHSFMTINAMDGTVIDRGLGY